MAITSVNNKTVDYNNTTVNKDIKVPVAVFKDEVVASKHTETSTKNDNHKQDNAKQENANQSNITENEILDAIAKANDTLRQTRTRCEFSYHKEVNRVSIKVLNKETSEVIREIPAEDSLKVMEKIWEIAGLIVDEKL